MKVCPILGARLACDRALGEPVESTILTPVGIAYFLLAVVYGTMLRLTGRPVSWKQRRYGGRTPVQ
jgi:hypothetical protein